MRDPQILIDQAEAVGMTLALCAGGQVLLGPSACLEDHPTLVGQLRQHRGDVAAYVRHCAAASRSDSSWLDPYRAKYEQPQAVPF